MSVPARWRESTLDDVCLRITDGAHLSPKSVEHGLPMASVKDMTSYGLNLETARQISGVDFSKLVHQGCKPNVGDVLIAKDGATALDTVCLVKDEIDVVLLSSVAILRPDPKVVLPEFLRYFLDAAPTRGYMKSAFTTGAAIPRVVLKDFKRARIRFPGLREQRCIAAILSAYDDLIENNTRRIAILEEMARRIYEEWFVHFRFPGHERVRMIETELGPVPDAWDVRTIADVCASVSYGYTASAVKSEVGPRFLRITDIVPSAIDWDAVPFCEIPEHKVQKYLLGRGDIVVARTGATTGYAKRLNKRHPATVFASYLVRVRASAHVSDLMLGILMQSDEYKRFIKANIGGAAQPQANAVVLTSMRLPVPPLSISNQFDQIVEPMVDEIEILSVKNANLRTTRDLLLPRLISGELDVSELPEPEAVAA